MSMDLEGQNDMGWSSGRCRSGPPHGRTAHQRSSKEVPPGTAPLRTSCDHPL